MRKLILVFVVVLILGISSSSQARIKLTTLPERQTVRIDIQNGRFTLVEEERTVNLQSGRNQVDFSWANINIDKDSIVFRVISGDGAIEIVNTNYPPNENALYWTVGAEKAGPAVVRLSYLIGNMAADPSYQGIVENDEKSLLLQAYMTVANTSGESFGETTVQPGVGKTIVQSFANGERKRMLAAKFVAAPIAKRFVFDAMIDQERTRMYYRIVNDKKNNLGEFPLPRGKVRLFIKEQTASGGDDVKSQAFLGEDWVPYTPLFAPLDLFVGVAQDVKVQRFDMPPEGGPQANIDEVTCPRITLDGKKSTTRPQFQHHRSRFRYRLQNFKTVAGAATTIPLTIVEHLDGEWIVEKIELKRIEGERNEQKETVVPHEGMVKMNRIDVGNLEFAIDVPPTTVDVKYDLYVTYLRKHRRH